MIGDGRTDDAGAANRDIAGDNIETDTTDVDAFFSFVCVDEVCDFFKDEAEGTD